MTFDDYSKMLKGVNNKQDFDRDFLTDIYNKIEKEPFTLAEDEDARLKLEGAKANSFQRKQDLYIKEA